MKPRQSPHLLALLDGTFLHAFPAVPLENWAIRPAEAWPRLGTIAVPMVACRPWPDLAEMTRFLGPIATRAPRSDVFSRYDCDPGVQILDRVGNPENDASISFVNLRIIGGPMPPFLDSVGRSEKRPRSCSGKEQPSFRNYRILPSTFLPDRTVPGPQRPTRPNPRECCRDPGRGGGVTPI